MKLFYYFLAFMFIILEGIVCVQLRHDYLQLWAYRLPLHFAYLMYPLAIYFYLQGIVCFIASLKKGRNRFIFASTISVILSLFFSFFTWTIILRLTHSQLQKTTDTHIDRRK